LRRTNQWKRIGFAFLSIELSMLRFTYFGRQRATRMRLLWVENHARFADLALKTFLTTHTVTVVPSLAEARLCLTREGFDAVLLDYDLDDGKGTEIFSFLDALPVRPLLVATSSHAEGNARLLQAGADAICSKMEFAHIEAVLGSVYRPGALTQLEEIVDKEK
jgi:DNA-binding response OmpR family regulator